MSGCGTIAGRKRHKDRGEDICQPCKEAWNAYQAQWRKNNNRAQADAAYHNARNRALTRLAHEYPERFKVLLAEERAVDRAS